MAQSYSHRRSRSRSPGPLPRLRRDYVAASSASSSTSPSMCSRPPSRSGVLRRPGNATANTARPYAPRCRVGPQSSIAQLPPASQHFSLVESNLADMTADPRSVAQHSAPLSYLPSSPDPPQILQSSYKNKGMFNNARDFTVTGTFVDASNVTYYNAFPTQFMEKLLEKTIRGAEFDSSDREPPPRCQPGTRLAVLDRCLSFISNCDGVKKMRWVFGAAGVGKSAIMQSVAESPDLQIGSPASVFFSVTGRDDGTKAIITLSYQFAAKSDSYRQVIEQEITRDPSLLRSSMSKQFNKLIVEPFIHNSRLNSAGRVLVIIDGLDECKDHRTQLELLRLISDLCLTYPSSPLVWLIASRPEPHINSFFSRQNVIPAYEKEEIPIDSDEARADVERFLREKLIEVKEESGALDPRWPEEKDFWKLAGAAGGLFAYAQTVIRYIGDPRTGSPVSQLSDVLYVIDKHPMTDVSREEHPMALLDALYERILSKVTPKIMVNTRKLLLALASGWDVSSRANGVDTNFIVLCNWLGMTADEAYAAVSHLRSILYVPARENAYQEKLRAFHKSSLDYVSDFTRSGFSSDILDEARQLTAECTFRILNEVPDGIKLDNLEVNFDYGSLASGPVTRDKIPLTWLVEEAGGWDNNKTRLSVYKLAIDKLLNGISGGDILFQSVFCIRFLVNTWSFFPQKFPCNKLLNAVFDETRRHDFMMHNILRQIPLGDVRHARLYKQRDIRLQFRGPATQMANLSDPWNSSCLHERKGEREVGKTHDWTTTFRGAVPYLPNNVDCVFCCERLKNQLKNWNGRDSDGTALALITSTEECCVQIRLVDPEDGVSEWTYSFWCCISWEERKKYVSTV